MAAINYFLFSIALAILAVVYRRTRRASNLPHPPGPPGLPIVGNLFDSPKEHAWITYWQWSKDYGKHFLPSSRVELTRIIGQIPTSSDSIYSATMSSSSTPTQSPRICWRSVGRPTQRDLCSPCWQICGSSNIYSLPWLICCVKMSIRLEYHFIEVRGAVEERSTGIPTRAWPTIGQAVSPDDYEGDPSPPTVDSRQPGRPFESLQTVSPRVLEDSRFLTIIQVGRCSYSWYRIRARHPRRQRSIHCRCEDCRGVLFRMHVPRVLPGGHLSLQYVKLSPVAALINSLSQ